MPLNGGGSSIFDMANWIEFQNVGATTAPACCVMRVTGVTVVEAGRVVLTCDQPNSFGDPGMCVINWATDVAANAYGQCTRAGIVLGLYDSGDGTPAFGQNWGPQNATWKLKKNTGGFFCLGAPTNTTATVAMFAPRPMLTFRGKTTAAAINKGASGTINIYTGTLGSEADSGQTMANVYNRYANIAIAKWVTCGWDFDNNGWELIAGEC